MRLKIRSLFFITFIAAVCCANAQEVLKKGEILDQRLAKSEVKKYRLNLTSNQLVGIKIEQRGLNILARVFSPDGKQVIEVNSAQTRFGTEQISLVARQTGAHRLEVRQASEAAAVGSFRIEIDELRGVTLQDTERLAKQAEIDDALLKASRLAGAADKQTRLANIVKLETWLALSRGTNRKSAQATFLVRLGINYAISGDKQKALESFTEARQIRRENKDQAGEAEALTEMAHIRSGMGDKLAALEFYQQSLKTYRDIGDPVGVASVLGNIGKAHSDLGELQHALNVYLESLSVSESGDDEKSAAFTLKKIGAIHISLGELQRALDYYEKSLVIFRRLQERQGEAEALSAIGVIYRLLNETEKSLDYHARSLEIWRGTNRILWQATTFYNIGLVYELTGERQKALENFLESLRLRRQNGDYRRIAVGLDFVGTAYRSLGDYQKAAANYEEALSYWEKASNRDGRAATLRNLGILHNLQKDAAKALGFYQNSLVIWRELRNRKEEAATLFLIASAERERGDLFQARKRMEEVLAIVEDFRTQILSQELRAAYFSSVQKYYDFYIDLLMSLHENKPTENFDISALLAGERARARSLLDLLKTSTADLRQGAAPELFERQRDLRRLLNVKADSQIYLLSQPGATESQRNALDAEIENLSKQYAEIEDRIRRTNSRYAALTEPPMLTLKEIQEKLLDPDTMLLEYRLGAERSYLWAVTKTEFRSYVLPQRDEIETLARRIIEPLTARSQAVTKESLKQKQERLAKAKTDFAQAAHELSRIIFADALGAKNIKRLAIVSDGALQYVPFAALPFPNKNPETAKNDRGGNFLISNFEIINLPSVSVLSAVRGESLRRAPPPKTITVFADPIFESDDPRLTAVKRKSDSGGRFLRAVFASADEGESLFPRLFASREEAETILSFVPRAESKLLVDFQANHSNVVNGRLAEYRIVHFATHGVLDTAKPELSGLVLSLYDEKGTRQDGYLRLHQIYSLNLPIEMVVLSACQTALGKEIRGEGLIGLTRGFMYAGAERVVASLWTVDDEATAELMGHFYRNHLQNKLPPAAALRAAQIEMLKTSRWKDPYFWSAFILQGEWR